MSSLLIYTNSFPYGNSETFLETEIQYLSLAFTDIFIIPTSGAGRQRPLPQNVKVLQPLRVGNWGTFHLYFRGLFSFFDMAKIPELWNTEKKVSILKKIKYFGLAVLTKNRIKARIPTGSFLHYSYWLDFNAFALSLLKTEKIISSFVSRAHGFDLYDERGEKSLSFIRKATLKNINKVFLISTHGMNYLSTKFPVLREKFTISKLGTSDPGILNQLPTREYVTIVSCSAVNINKRIDLILESFEKFKHKYSNIKVKWYHLGGGNGLETIIKDAEGKFEGSNIEFLSPGWLTNEKIFNFYKTVPVDLFINVSLNEGIPVSIMEAQSFAIPVLATNVGGNSEIVNIENGVLVSPYPEPEILADIYFDFFINRSEKVIKRNNSRKWWEQNYNAGENYRLFSYELSKMGTVN